MEDLEPVNRAMIVAPHPDDAEFGCAGTVAKLTDAGKEVFYVIATNGNKGGRDTDMSASYLRDERRAEQEAAARVLGVKEVVFLDFGDGDLEDDHTFRSSLVYEIRRLKPDIVFTTDPFRTSFYIHRDHRITGLVTIDAVFPYARDKLHYPEHIESGLLGHNVQEVFFWGAEMPNVFIDIGDAVEKKIESLAAHQSQLSDWAGGKDQTAFGDMIRKMCRRPAQQHGLDFEYAETFRKFGIRRMWEES
jgi:LmbE family N-acetylglucosaminyl deacetylase